MLENPSRPASGPGEMDNTTGAALRLLVVDDHPLFRAGLRHLLNLLGSELNVVEAGSGEEALACLDEDDAFDLVLMDLLMPGFSGFEALKEVCKRVPSVPVVVVSVKERPEDVRLAIESGAMGYIPKSSSPEVLINALKLVFSGGVYLPPNLLA